MTFQRQEQNFFHSRQDGETLSGVVERITYRAENSDFVILKLQPESFSGLVTAKGHVAFLEAGEFVTLEGHWQTDANYGRQFKFQKARAAAPKTEAGLTKYLASNLVDGIGATFARRLVDHFGDEVLEVVANQPERLLEVEGIGKKRQQQIIEALATQDKKRDDLVVLYSLGLNAPHASEMIKRFGETAVSQVRNDPYQLAQDIRGIGFLTADKIALLAGLEKASPKRAKAGLRHFLRELSEQGDTVVLTEELIEVTAQSLGIPHDGLHAALLEARREGEVIEEAFSGEFYVGLSDLLHYEQTIARSLIDLQFSEVSLVPRIQVDKALAWYANQSQLKFTDEQQLAVRMCLESRVSVITGGPGVGKTTILRAVVAILHAKRIDIALAAPTGRAAKRLEEATGQRAKTVHRLLEYRPGGIDGFRRNAQNPLTEAFIIIDECSMLDIQMTAALVSAVQNGASLCFVGDQDQLPSVGPGAVLRDLLESQAVPKAALSSVFRQQSSSTIVTNAHKINRGQMPVIGDLNSRAGTGSQQFYFIERKDAQSTHDTILNLVTKRIPKAFDVDPVLDIQVLCPMHRGGAGTSQLNSSLQNVLTNKSGEKVRTKKFEFYVGDKVMQLKNDYDRDVFNGDLGRVLAVDSENSALTVEFAERPIRYAQNALSGLGLAYAASIHKSQGSEFPVVVIPILREHFVMLKRNLLYTGMTRARRLVVLVGQRRALELAVKADDMHHRRSTLGVRLAEAFLARQRFLNQG